ncbi:MAG: exodeoxyribonuclease III [Saprospiraceae bacterium]|nr:exodeoxyribonuclease III [Saprospiraceae bacterium]MCB9327314.1 exodeoxyribonuclease III [Lewinellaceae bacterium]
MKIATYNVNGIRAAITKGLFEWVDEQDFDVLCLQETKAEESQIDESVLDNAGYHHYWHSAEKKGYSGVATFTKTPATQVIAGMNNQKYDSEGRILRTDFGDITLLNCYFPSGSSGEDRHEFKMQFLADFAPWIETLKKERPNLIIVGDYNIVHKEIDIHNPERKDNPSGYRPEERAWMDDWFGKMGFTDAFRWLHSEQQDVYSWWSYRAGSRQKNKGWRIDYISVSDTLKDRVQSVVHYPHVLHSDHCCIEMEMAE